MPGKRPLPASATPGRRRSAENNLAGAGQQRGRAAPWGSAAALGEQVLEFGAERRPEVVARQPVGDVGGEEADLRAAVEAAALELEPVERLLLGEPDHGVGELDLAARAARLV